MAEEKIEMDVLDGDLEEEVEITGGEDIDDDDRDDTSGGDDDEHRYEMEGYSERVQKRIKKLTFDMHEERRRAEAAERTRDEAIRFTQAQQNELAALRRAAAEDREAFQKEAGGRFTAEIAAAQKDLKEAYDVGDSDKIVEAQTKIAELTAQKAAVSWSRPAQQPQQAQQSAQQAQRQQPQLSSRGQRWMSENDWFWKDDRMTAYAMGVHNSIQKEGRIPMDSEEYYRQIDKEMRQTFPDRFDKPVSTDTVVAAPSRRAPKKPRKVRLTETQMAFIKRAGITPEQYVAELMKGNSDE